MVHPPKRRIAANGFAHCYWLIIWATGWRS